MNDADAERLEGAKRALVVYALIASVFFGAWWISPVARAGRAQRPEPASTAAERQQSPSALSLPADSATADTARTAPVDPPATAVEPASPAGAETAPDVPAEQTAPARPPIADGGDDFPSGRISRTCKTFYVLSDVRDGTQYAAVDMSAKLQIIVWLQSDIPARLRFTRGYPGAGIVSLPDLTLQADVSAGPQVVLVPPLPAGSYALHLDGYFVGTVVVK